MTRYFYTDPLAAAWMAKHFGLEFQSLATDSDEPYWQIRFISGQPYRLTPSRRSGIEVQEDGLLFVHPQSVHFLRPRVGDLIEGMRIGTVFEVRDDEICVDVHGGDWEMDVDRVQVIRRDGKPFFWPESQAA